MYCSSKQHLQNDQRRSHKTESYNAYANLWNAISRYWIEAWSRCGGRWIVMTHFCITPNGTSFFACLSALFHTWRTRHITAAITAVLCTDLCIAIHCDRSRPKPIFRLCTFSNSRWAIHVARAMKAILYTPISMAFHVSDGEKICFLCTVLHFS